MWVEGPVSLAVATPEEGPRMGELSWGAQLPELVCPAVGAGRQGQEVSVSLLLGGRPLLARHQGRGEKLVLTGQKEHASPLLPAWKLLVSCCAQLR